MTTSRYWQNKKWYNIIDVIVFNLICSECEYPFEGWFDDTKSFNNQKKRKLINCPNCESSNVSKTLVAPNVSKKSNSKPSEEVANIRSNIPAGKGSNWNHPLLFISCNRLAVTASPGIIIPRKNIPTNQINLNETATINVKQIMYPIRINR